MKMKCGKKTAKAVMWFLASGFSAVILVYMTYAYDWKAAALAFVAGWIGVKFKTLHYDCWEEDYESQD